jgi:hypothetical protein
MIVINCFRYLEILINDQRFQEWNKRKDQTWSPKSSRYFFDFISEDSSQLDVQFIKCGLLLGWRLDISWIIG